ncbi:MAG: nitroreductase family protein [Treponema sp.]|jgi:nitroreductase|nr:nitroreductase family protein [Treponema sp.]
MKKFLLAFGLVCALGALAAAQSKADVILNHYAARSFVAGAISRPDLDTLIRAGIRAPSARNAQPWHFTVVQNVELARRIISDVKDGNVLIVISASGDGKPTADTLDCGLAAESIYLAAQALGLGSRIYTGPVSAINRGLKQDLGLPAGYSAVVVVRIGKIAPVDAVSAASSRKAEGDLVNYK